MCIILINLNVLLIGAMSIQYRLRWIDMLLPEQVYFLLMNVKLICIKFM